jgi:hypothetical protein
VGDGVVLVFDGHIDPAYSTANSFVDRVHKVQKSWLFQEARFRTDICKYITNAPIFFLEGLNICLHFCLAEVFPRLQLECREEVLGFQHPVSENSYFPNAITGAFVYYKTDARPCPIVVKFHNRRADFSPEKSEAPVVFQDAEPVPFQIVRIPIAPNKPEPPGFGLDFGSELCIAGDRIANEICPKYPLSGSFADEKDDSRVIGVGTFY